MPRPILLLVLLCLPLLATAQSIDSSSLRADAPKLRAAQMLQAEQERDTAPISNGFRLEPFGANLFTGGFGGDREDGLNPGYILQPGDRVSVRIWGASEFNESLVIDPQGNIFIPSVGPIPVGGVRNDQLNERVMLAVSAVYTDNVRVYTSLDGSQPVAVFVTGYVLSPGSFAGIPSNSILHFIDQAGGIDPNRGSYRSIAIKRAGRVIAEIDLYDFLLDGKLDNVQFRDGDTIVIGARGSVVSVTGDVGNEVMLEMENDTARGADVVAIAMTGPAVSHVGFSGVRNGVPFSSYLPLAEFRTAKVRNGDSVQFQTDQHDQVIVVDVEGSHYGPSRYAVPLNTRLQELLDYIEVDLGLADVQAVSLKRESVALRQEAALKESLQRLQARYLTASSQTDQESAIRAQEAQLIGEFVRTARNVKPTGRLVVANDNEIFNVRLQTGDTITIPPKSDANSA